MGVCIVRLFSPLQLNYSAFHIIHLYPNILFPLPPLLQARGAPQRRATPAPPSPTGARGHIRNIDEKPTAQIISRGVTVPRPTERLMHLKTEIRCLNLRPQSSKAALNLSGCDCGQFCLIKLGWRQTHPCLQILFLPMPPWAHQPQAHTHTHTHAHTHQPGRSRY